MCFFEQQPDTNIKEISFELHKIQNRNYCSTPCNTNKELRIILLQSRTQNLTGFNKVSNPRFKNKYQVNEGTK